MAVPPFLYSKHKQKFDAYRKAMIKKKLHEINKAKDLLIKEGFKRGITIKDMRFIESTTDKAHYITLDIPFSYCIPLSNINEKTLR